MNGEIRTALGDGSPVVFTEGAWEAVGELARNHLPPFVPSAAASEMLREQQELDGREAEEIGRATHDTFLDNGQDPNLPGPTH